MVFNIKHFSSAHVQINWCCPGWKSCLEGAANSTTATGATGATNARYMWGFQDIWSVIQFVGLFFMPVWPGCLIQKSQWKEAKEILIQIRNTNAVDEENYEIKSNYEEMKRSHEMTECSRSWRSTISYPLVLTDVGDAMFYQKPLHAMWRMSSRDIRNGRILCRQFVEYSDLFLIVALSSADFLWLQVLNIFEYFICWRHSRM